MKINSYKGRIDMEDFLEQIIEFHGSLAPGLVLGGFMVDWAWEAMESAELVDAVVETRKCIPDAVQLLTKCSIGNGWLRILDWGKLALTLYDFETSEGARVYVDMQKLDHYPMVRAWAMKEKSKEELPLEPLVDEMIMAHRNVFSCSRVKVGKIEDHLASYDRPRICGKCGESFLFADGKICPGCIESYY